MKILFYYYMGGGGALSNVILLLKTLAENHPEDTIEIVTSPSVVWGVLEQQANIRIHRLRWTGWKEVDRLLLGWWFIPRMVRQIRPDILWSLNFGSYRRVSVPSVLSVHNSHQVYPLGATRSHPGKRSHVLAIRWFFRRSLRVVDGVVVQTPLMGSYVRKIRGAPARLVVAPKAVENASDVPPASLDPKLAKLLDNGVGQQQAFTFLYVATWIPHKNHKILVQALATLAQQNVKARLVLTVSTEQLLSLRLPETAALIDKGLLLPVGWVGKTQLRAIYAACDACVMPSMMESLSSAHIEAMQWARPQIVSELPYARDLCAEAALYADPANPKEWVKQMLLMINDPALRRRLVTAGQVEMQKFPRSWQAAADIIHCLFETLHNS